MPRFKAQDFLAEAQRQASLLLNYFLVAVPIHLETVDRYAHNGRFDDATFRQPWLYSEDVDEDLTYSWNMPTGMEWPGTLYSTSMPGHELPLEKFNADEEVEFIPSSNPNSPGISVQDCQRLQQRVGGDSEHEGEIIDVRPAEQPKFTARDYLLELPHLLPAADVNDSRFNIKQLCSHLKKKQVVDPFLSASGMPLTQSLFSKNDQKPLFKQEEVTRRNEVEDASSLDLPAREDFLGKEVEEGSSLEAVLTDDPDVTTSQLTAEAVQPEMDMDSNEVDRVAAITKEFSHLRTLTINNGSRVGREVLAIEQKPAADDEPMKWTIKKTSDDDPVAGLIAEDPVVVTIGSSPPPSLPSPFNNPESVTSFEVDWGVKENIISQDTVERISNQQWTDEKYFGTVSSWLVKEPSTTKPDESQRLHSELSKELDLTPEPTKHPDQQEIFSEDFYKPIAPPAETLNSWRRCTEEFISSHGVYEGTTDAQNVSQIKIDWGDPDPLLTKVPLNDIGNLKSSTKMATLERDVQNLNNARSISSKLAGMLKKSEAASGALPGSLEAEENTGITEDGCKKTEDDCHKDKKLKTETLTTLTDENEKESIYKAEGSTFLSVHELDSKKQLSDRPDIGKMQSVKSRKPEKRKFGGFNDPLKDFLFLSGLTSGRTAVSEQFTAAKKRELIPEEVKEEVKEPEEDKPVQEPSTPPVAPSDPDIIVEKTVEPPTDRPEKTHSKSKAKTKIVTVNIPDDFQEVLDVIKEFGGPLLKQLQSNGDIPSTHTYPTLSPRVVGALIKEEFESTKRRLKQDSDKVKHLVQLFICLSVRETALHCHLTSALEGLGIMVQKYSSVIQGSLNDLQEKLNQLSAKLKEASREHPKIAEMTRQITSWLSRKILKAREDQDLKVLVILKRDSASLTESIVTSLNTITGLKAVSLEPSLPASPHTTSRALDSHNCLLVAASQLAHDFLWAQFSLVVEYECPDEDPSIWQGLCVRQNIRHLGFTMGRESEGNGGKLDEMEDRPSTPETSLKLLCSSKLTEDSQLLHLLESKYNVTILERDYDIFRVCYADLIVDVVNGIVLMTSQDILSTGIEGLTKRVNFLAQQFQKIWIIIREDGNEKSGLQSKAFRKCICQLYSVIAQYTQKEHQYEVKVLFSSSLEEVAEIVKMVCKTAEENMSSVWHKDDWLKRQCITVQPSKHESFLTQFPSVNSFTAQVLLTFAPLRKLLSTPAEDLITLAPWVPPKFLKTFESYTSCSFDVAGLADDPGDHFSRAAQPNIGPATEDTLDSHMDVRLKTEPRPPVSPLSDSSLDSPLPVVDIGGGLNTAAASLDPSHSDQLQRSTMFSLERGDGCGIRQASTSHPTRESLFNPSYGPSMEDQHNASSTATIRGPAEHCHAGTVGSVMEDGNEEQHHHILSVMENVGASGMQNRPSYHQGNILPRSGSSSLYRKDSVGTEMSGRNIPQYHHPSEASYQDLTRHPQAASSYHDPRSQDERTALELLHAGRFEVGAGDSTGGNTSVGQAARLSEQQAVRYRDSVHLRRSTPVGQIPRLPEHLSVNYGQGLPGEYDGGSDRNGIHQLRGSAPGMIQCGAAPEIVQRGTAQEMIQGVEYPQVCGPAPEMIRRVDYPQVCGTAPEITQRGTAPGISQRVDYLQESRDPFQKIKDDCLRQLNTGAGRRVNLLPPLMTRTRDVQQQRSVVRPFHRAGQPISQDHVQGYLHDDQRSTRYGRAPPDVALFDESGWKRRLQPGPSSGGGQTSSTHGMDHLQPSGYSTPSSSASKHRRLAYQRDPTSSDGQTKLTFLS